MTNTDGTRSGSDGQKRVNECEDVFLARIPEWVVPLGAGCLAAATGITLVGALYGWYAVVTGQTLGYPQFYIILAAAEFSFVTVLQAVGTHYARQRIKWMWTMLAAIFGAFTFVVVPLSIVAVLCLGSGKYHFASHTPQTTHE